MNRHLVPSICLVAALTLLGASTGSGSTQKTALSTRVTINSVALLASGCGTEVTCVEVRWAVQNEPANPQVMSFEVTGKLTTSNGSCNSNAQNISDHAARSAKVGFFQGGSCTGQANSAEITVKLFTRDIEGQKVLTSTATKAQTF